MPQAVRSVPGAGRQGEDRVLTVPNALSALRLVCLPVFVVLLAQPHERGRPAAAFLLAGGGLHRRARRLYRPAFRPGEHAGQDGRPPGRPGVGAVRAGRGYGHRRLPIWLVVVIALREGVVLAGSGLLFFFSRTTRIDVSRAGKAGALGMMMALPLFILAHAPFRYHEAALVVAWVAVGAGQVLAWAAVVQYVPKARSAWAAGRRATPEAGAMTPSGPGAR